MQGSASPAALERRPRPSNVVIRWLQTGWHAFTRIGCMERFQEKIRANSQTSCGCIFTASLRSMMGDPSFLRRPCKAATSPLPPRAAYSRQGWHRRLRRDRKKRRLREAAQPRPQAALTTRGRAAQRKPGLFLKRPRPQLPFRDVPGSSSLRGKPAAPKRPHSAGGRFHPVAHRMAGTSWTSHSIFSAGLLIR